MTVAPAGAATLVVPRRYCGPPSSGNGGWTAGSLAWLATSEAASGAARERCWPTVRVSLRQPPPLDTPMPVTTEPDGSAVARAGDAVVASAQVVEASPTPVEPVPAAEARAAASSYAGLRHHPFPTCFSCGTDRDEGDGLRLFPGRVADAPETGHARVATTWSPHPSVGHDFSARTDELPRASLAATWAALDCVGAWAGDLEDRLMVLASMTARVDCLPVIGEEHVLLGEGRGSEGRKTFTASTLYDPDGRVVGCAEHLWIAIDPADFG